MISFFRKFFSNNRIKDLSGLRDTGKCIKVNTDSIDIKQISYIEEIQKRGALEIRMLDALANRDQMTKVKVDGCYFIVDYKAENGQKTKLMSHFIAKDKATLSFLLLNQREINIYLDFNNPENCFFDLFFL